MVADHYRKAGVDISQSDDLVSTIKPWVERTHGAGVIANYGGFAGVYDFEHLRERFNHPLIVQSMDGVGTKLMVAALANHFQDIGQDLLSATTNDVIVCGATPLTCLDYLATANLDSAIVETIIKNLCDHCQQHDIALLGGEMAAMPGVYCNKAWDVVGVVTGVVDREQLIDGRAVAAAQAVIGLGSSGLHTNGYSLARHVLFEKAGLTVDDCPSQLTTSVSEALLAAHINYWPAVRALLQAEVPIAAMAHITGGGLAGNLQRMLPPDVQVHLATNGLPRPAIFDLIQQLGDISQQEMREVFNLGVGFCLIVDAIRVDQAMACVQSAMPELNIAVIGETMAGEREIVWPST